MNGPLGMEMHEDKGRSGESGVPNHHTPQDGRGASTETVLVPQRYNRAFTT